MSTPISPNSRIIKMGMATLLGFPLLALIVVFVFEEYPYAFTYGFLWDIPWYTQIFLGSAVGIIFGMISWAIVKLPVLSEVSKKYSQLIGNMHLKWIHILFLSCCAGIGEEFFFRGVLQQYWGITITAIFFVAIHGYLNIKNRPLFFYGVVMTGMIMGIGYLSQSYGMLTAMTAHTWIDIVLLYQLSKSNCA